MAETSFTFCKIANPGTNQLVLGRIDGDLVSQSIAPTGSNQVTTIVAPNVGEAVLAMVATDTAVHVAFGTAPDATNTALRIFCPANSVRNFLVPAGYKGAVAT
jgi:hypothetical protein